MATFLLCGFHSVPSQNNIKSSLVIDSRGARVIYYAEDKMDIVEFPAQLNPLLNGQPAMREQMMVLTTIPIGAPICHTWRSSENSKLEIPFC